MREGETVSETPKPVCLVVGPFGSPGDKMRAWFEFLQDEVIVPALSADFDVVCMLTDPEPGDVMERLRRLLGDAAVVVADLTYARPNVFYEIGWRQALDKPCVLVRRDGEAAHFNLSTQEVISIDAEYKKERHQYSVVGLRELQANLKGQVAAAMGKEAPLTRLSHESHQARFYDWSVTYSNSIAGDWLLKQCDEVRASIEQYEKGGGIERKDDEPFTRRFAEYLELKNAASQTYDGKLFYIVNTQSGDTVFGCGVFRFPKTTLSMEAQCAEIDDTLEVTFRQPSRQVEVFGRTVELPPYRYTVKFNKKNRRSRRMTGMIEHPDTKTVIGETVLVPFLGRLG